MSLLPASLLNDLDTEAILEWLNERWLHIAITSMTLAVSTAAMFMLNRIDYPARLFHRVDPTSTMDGGMLVAQVLQAHNVKCVFTLCGGHISTILVGCEKLGIRVIDTRHEATTVFAADAVARLTGNIGVAVVTAGPGVTNTITAIKNAQMAESPVLILGGGAATLSKGRGALQDIDQMNVCRPACKWVARVTRVRDIVPTLREAIRIARSGTPGPVFVELPIDILYEYKLARSLVSVGESKSKRQKPLFERVANRAKMMILEQLIDSIFAGAFVPRPLSPLPLSIPLHRKADLMRTVQLIREARRPLLLLGSQSLQPPVSAENIAAAVRGLGIPCFLGGMARGLLGASDKNSTERRLNFRHKRKEATLEADLIVLAGITVDFRLDYGRILNRQARIVAVNRDRQTLYLNSDMFWRPTLAVQADVGSFLVDLFSTARDTHNLQTTHANWAEWFASLEKREDERDAEIVKQAALEPAGGASGTVEARAVNNLRLLRDIDAALSDRTILIADGGDFVGSAAYTLRPRAPLSWLDPGAFGTLGSGGGFALGAKAVRPDADVVIIYGDGALGFSMMEFDSFERHRLPVMAVVGNDACWSQIAREQVRYLKSNVACQLAYTSYNEAVQGLGSHGEVISTANLDRIREIIEEARRRARDEKQSTLLNCLIAKSSFRDGSISV